MRNYVQLFFGRMDYKDAGNNDLHIVFLEPTQADVELANQELAENLIANGYHDTHGYTLGPRYFCLDKVNLAQIIGSGASPEFLWDFPDTAAQFTGTGTPRKGWTDAAGVRRKPTPSDKEPESSGKIDTSGAQTLVDTFLEMMTTLIGVYTSQGDKRTAGIIKDLLDQFLSGKKSITDILDELRKLFII